MNQIHQGVPCKVIPPPLIVMVLSVVCAVLQWGKPLKIATGFNDALFVLGIVLVVASGVLALYARKTLLLNNTTITFGASLGAVTLNGAGGFVFLASNSL